MAIEAVRRPGRIALAFALVTSACAAAKTGGEVGRDGAVGIDAEPVDAGGGEADAATAVEGAIYVSVVGADSNAGTEPQHPLRHLGFAITRAAACAPEPCELRISEGTFEEAVTLVAGVDLIGGFQPGFADRDPTIYPVVITDDVEQVVTADALTARTVIDGLTIRGGDLGLVGGAATTHALWVRDCGEHLVLRALRIEGGRAGRGVDGGDGTLTSCTATGGTGGAAYNCGGGTGGTGNASGDPSAAGTGGGGGGSNCPNACPLVGGDGVSAGVIGGNGGNGDDGDNGVQVGDSDGDFTDDVWGAITGGAGARGGHGTGGSGGGSGGTKRFAACFGCGTLLGGRGGDGAPGGCGGSGGSAGGGGGASFALTLIRTRVTADDVHLVGGIGGRGGDGGDGHPGAPGSTNGQTGRQNAPSQQCGLITYYSGAGAAGGIGGHGGHGGGGAGGTGGPAIGVALVGDAELVAGEPGSVTIDLGTPGDGGTGGTGIDLAASGTAGAAVETATY